MSQKNPYEDMFEMGRLMVKDVCATVAGYVNAFVDELKDEEEKSNVSEEKPNNGCYGDCCKNDTQDKWDDDDDYDDDVDADDFYDGASIEDIIRLMILPLTYTLWSEDSALSVWQIGNICKSANIMVDDHVKDLIRKYLNEYGFTSDTVTRQDGVVHRVYWYDKDTANAIRNVRGTNDHFRAYGSAY